MENVTQRIHESKTSNNGEVIELTFPNGSKYDDCKNHAHKLNLNPFVIRPLDNDTWQFLCAYSWRLSFLNKFGYWPEG